MNEIPTRETSPSFTERFVEKICKFRQQLFFLLVLEVAMLLFVGFSFVFVEPGTSSYFILQLDAIILGVSIAMVLGTLYVCRTAE